jgi:hypothetical protein
MLPNYFPDGGQAPEYNTSDATLWWAWALHGYYKATGDIDFVKAAAAAVARSGGLAQERHQTRPKRLDSDGLITGGDASVQLTWMDAKVGNYVVTPRSGKAVEINALWYNFLLTLKFLRDEVGAKLGAASMPPSSRRLFGAGSSVPGRFRKVLAGKRRLSGRRHSPRRQPRFGHSPQPAYGSEPHLSDTLTGESEENVGCGGKQTAHPHGSAHSLARSS